MRLCRCHLVEIGKLGRVGEKRFGVVVDAARRLLRRNESAHVLCNGCDTGVEALARFASSPIGVSARPTERRERLCTSRNALASLESIVASSRSTSAEATIAAVFLAMRCASAASCVASSASARLPCLAGELRELGDAVDALRDRRIAFGEVGQVLPIFQQPLGVCIDAIPAGLDVLQESLERLVVGDVRP
jgi:hypothetical protein